MHIKTIFRTRLAKQSKLLKLGSITVAFTALKLRTAENSMYDGAEGMVALAMITGHKIYVDQFLGANHYIT